MYFILIEKEKLLVMFIGRGAGHSIMSILIEYIKNHNKVIIESIVRDACHNLELIGEKSRQNGGSMYRIPQMIYKINSIPIDDFKKNWKIFQIIKNPYHLIYARYLSRFIVGKKAPRPNYTFRNWIDDIYNWKFLNQNIPFMNHMAQRIGLNLQTNHRSLSWQDKCYKWKKKRDKYLKNDTKNQYLKNHKNQDIVEGNFNDDFLNFIDNLMAKKINHPFYKVYDTSELHYMIRDLGLSESDLKYEKFVPNIKINDKKKYDMDPKKIKKIYLTKKIKMKNLDIKTSHNLNVKREEELSIADFYNKNLKKKI